MNKTSNLAPVKRRSYIISHTDGLMESRNSEITKELCEYYGRLRSRQNWQNSEVSKRPTCRHCRDKGWVELEGTPVIVDYGPILNKRGNPRTAKRRINGVMTKTEKYGPIKKAQVRWTEACICVKRQIENAERLDADSIVMGTFGD